MKKNLFIIAIVFIIQVSNAQTGIEYFGQTPPGSVPKVFVPEIFTGYVHGFVAISPKGDEIFWVENPSTERIFYSKFENGIWTKPALAEFAKDYLTVNNGGLTFSPDGSKLFFYSARPGGIGGIDTWYVERTVSGWGNPINVGEPYNSTDTDLAPLFTNKGNAYSIRLNDKHEAVPLSYKYSNSKFSDPIPIDIHPDYSPWWSIYISPNEDYLIFASGADNADLYIRFKNKEDKWGTPINIGDKINTKVWERFPVVSPDGKYLFFTRELNSQNVFWVSTAFIDSLKQTVTGIKVEETILPQNIHLIQNYPNPFNPTTVINYQLSDYCTVKLKIYDTLGREIKTLVDSNRSAGKYSTVWDGTDDSNNPVSSGIYFYSLLTNEISIQKKMILIR